MGGAESAAAGGDVAGCAAGQEAMQAPEIAIVLDRHVVMQAHVSFTEPSGRALDPAGAALV